MPHGIANLTWPAPEDDARYLADSFRRFLASRGGTPFLAQRLKPALTAAFAEAPWSEAEWGCSS